MLKDPKLEKQSKKIAQLQRRLREAKKLNTYSVFNVYEEYKYQQEVEREDQNTCYWGVKYLHDKELELISERVVATYEQDWEDLIECMKEETEELIKNKMDEKEK